MSETFEPYLIYCPFRQNEQVVTSTRYVFDNTNRGDRFVIIQRTISGYGIFETGANAYQVPAEHAFIALPPEKSIYYYPREATEPWRFSWINLYGDLAYSLMQQFRERHGPVVPLPSHTPAGGRFLAMGGRADSVDRPKNLLTDPFETSYTCYRFIMEWAKQLSSQPKPDRNEALENAVNLCHLRFREPIGVKELAAVCGLTREHFTRIFTAYTGHSPAAYLRSLRVEAARAMLQEATVPLSEVALRCGFPSLRAMKAALSGTDAQTGGGKNA